MLWAKYTNIGPLIQPPNRNKEKFNCGIAAASSVYLMTLEPKIKLHNYSLPLIPNPDN